MTPKREYDFPSMLPGDIEPEVVPDVTGLVSNREDAMKLRQLIINYADIGAQEKELKQIKTPVTNSIKKMLNEYKVSRAMCDSFRVAYYPISRATIDKEKLAIAMSEFGILPDHIRAIIDRASNKSQSWQIRITPPGARDYGARESDE